MVFIRASLAGLAVVSLCMADISGTVTDSGATPVPGAVVQLEKGGQTAITDANGRFTLVIESSASLPVNSKSLPDGLSARISGNMLTLTTSKRTALEIAAFDLNGKLFFTVRRALDAGTHSIGLPQMGTGVYLYKVKTGNKEIVIKGNAVGGISFGSPAATQVPSIRGPAKQAKTTAEINDVFAVTKAGLLNYRCVIKNSDTDDMVIRMIANAGDVADADGNVYQTVRIGSQVWMTENLRATKYSDGSPIPFDTSNATWNSAKTPKYCFYQNMADADSIKIRKYGALYNWHVVNPANPKKIAPTGWHVPSDAEWDTLQNNLFDKDYNRNFSASGGRIAKLLAAGTDWHTNSITGAIGCDLTKNNASGFSALPGGFRYYDGSFFHQRDLGYWWSATEYNASYARYRFLDYSFDALDRSYYFPSCGFSVRLVKD